MQDTVRDASVGDGKRDGILTVEALEERIADCLGMDAAVFVPSGTMGNQVFVRVHADLGQEILVDRDTHRYASEYGGFTLLSQLQVWPIDAVMDSCLAPEVVRDVHSEQPQWPSGGLLTFENTHNAYGDRAIAPETIDSTVAAAQGLRLSVYLDAVTNRGD